MKTTLKEIAKEIKAELQKINGVKVSTSSKDGHLYVHLMAANFAPVVNNEIVYEGSYGRKDETKKFDGYFSVNQYNFMNSINLTIDSKVFFQLVEEIVKKYHWDKSDLMTDYFNCAFYYSYSIGRYDKPFIQN